jgi:hypothetical protein
MTEARALEDTGARASGFGSQCAKGAANTKLRLLLAFPCVSFRERVIKTVLTGNTVWDAYFVYLEKTVLDGVLVHFNPQSLVTQGFNWVQARCSSGGQHAEHQTDHDADTQRQHDR